MQSVLNELDLSRCVILDTETTGVSIADEVIEIAVLAADTRETLFNERFRPFISISDAAQAVHGIDGEQLISSPRFYEHAQDLIKVIQGKTIIGWRIDFDVRLIGQTIKSQGIERNNYEPHTWFDLKPAYLDRLMNQYRFVGDGTKRELGRQTHLITACENENIDIRDLTPHRALADCQMVHRLLHTMIKRA